MAPAGVRKSHRRLAGLSACRAAVASGGDLGAEGRSDGIAAAFAILAFFFFNQAVIISTAFIGSYFVMRGISAFAGGFPPAFQLIEQVKAGVLVNIDPTFYGYLAGMVVLAVIGAVVQFKLYNRMEEHEKHPYDRNHNAVY